MESNIQVAVRIRPILSHQLGSQQILDYTQNTITVIDSARFMKGTFNKVYTQSSTQQEVFNFIQNGISNLNQGVNCTIFAYGQTGTGKTFTIFGSNPIKALLNSPQGFGVIPRTVQSIFHSFSQTKTYSLSFYQLYNQHIYDLISDAQRKNPLKIRENSSLGTYLEGLTEYIVDSQESCFQLLIRGENNRAKRGTRVNPTSSRSHVVFQITVQGNTPDPTGKITRAKLFICDLAGSEKSNTQQEIKSEHFNQLRSINLSLTTLGKVIFSLAKRKNSFVSYRESKLTFLLKDALGGNSNTFLIGTVAPVKQYASQVINTLKFATAASKIKVLATVNELAANDNKLVAKLQREIKYLKDILSMRQTGSPDLLKLQQRLLSLQEQNKKLKEISHNFSVDQVQKLREENKKMRVQIQQIMQKTGESFPDLQTRSRSSRGSQKIPLPEIPVRIRRNNQIQTKITSLTQYLDTQKRIKGNQQMMRQTMRLKNLENIQQFRQARAQEAQKALQKAKMDQQRLLKSTQTQRFRKYSEMNIRKMKEIENVRKTIAKAENERDKAFQNLEKVRMKKAHSSVSPMRSTRMNFPRPIDNNIQTKQ